MGSDWWTIFEGLNIPPEAFVPNGADIERKNIERMFGGKMKIYIYAANTKHATWNVPIDEDVAKRYNYNWNTQHQTVELWNFPEDNNSESELVEWIDNRIKSYQYIASSELVIRTTSSIVFTAIRVAVKEGRLSGTNVYTTFQDVDGKIHQPVLDQDGRSDYWPDGMFDTYSKLLRRII